MMAETFLIAWQSPKSRSWYPIGRLMRANGRFRFAYTKGAENANRSDGFEPLPSFPEFDKVYNSDQLFPLVSNRLPNSSRPDYSEYLKWLDLPKDTQDPLVILSRSGGYRTTDAFEIFPLPEENETGEYQIRFFAHGLQYFPPASIERINKLEVGERLLISWDWQNPYDPTAMALRTHDSFVGDRHLVGFCPRYLTKDVLHAFLKRDSKMIGDPVIVTTERVNPAPAPLQVRLLCTLKACWPPGFRPFSGPEYKPVTSSNGPERDCRESGAT